MNDNRCMVCKYLGDHAHKELSQERIYRERGGSITLNLCYGHSWELFRTGQKRFLKSYQENFMHVFGTESEKELIEHLKGEGKANPLAWSL